MGVGEHHRRARAAVGLLAVGLVPQLWAARYVGAERCAGCHPAQAARHRLTAHAHALYRAAEHPLASAFAAAPPAVRPPDFRFSFSKDADHVRVSAQGAGDAIEMELEWAFGAGGQGVTFVSRGNSAWYLEHAMSYFPRAGVFDNTPGHDQPAETLTQAVGMLYPLEGPSNSVVSCFDCHSTGPVTASPNGVTVGEQGVQCDSCHVPGGDHFAAVALGEVAAARRAVVNPRRLAAAELSRVCGQCHRPPDAAEQSGALSVDWNDPWNVRHAPPYLQRSACFNKSSGALSCLSCHPAHEPLRRGEAGYYAERCRQCHPSSSHSAPVVSDDCTSCHMPKVRPHRRLAFTNHWIGVYDKDKPLKPTR